MCASLVTCPFPCLASFLFLPCVSSAPRLWWDRPLVSPCYNTTRALLSSLRDAPLSRCINASDIPDRQLYAAKSCTRATRGTPARRLPARVSHHDLLRLTAHPAACRHSFWLGLAHGQSAVMRKTFSLVARPRLGTTTAMTCGGLAGGTWRPAAWIEDWRVLSSRAELFGWPCFGRRPRNTAAIP